MTDPVKDDCPSGWALTTLGEPLQWGSGGTPLSSRTDYYGGDIPWAIIGDLNDGYVSETASFITEDGLQNSSAKWVEPFSVLLAMYGSIGKLGINTVPLTTNQAIAFTNPRPISSKYLFYYLMSARAGLISRGKGGTQSNISQTVIKGFPFLVAPLPEQDRIVSAVESYLTRLDDAMATLERVQRNLKRYRASVLKAAVEGRLVPTEAELARAEGREYEPASVLLEGILAERRRRWEEAELAKLKAKGNVPKNDKWKAKYVEPAGPDTSVLPELPEGWCWASLNELGKVSGGVTQNARRLTLGLEVPYLRVANVYANELRLDEVKTIGIFDAELSRVLLAPGDLLIVEGNGSVEQIGRVALWDGSISQCIHQNHLIKVRFSLVGLSRWSLHWLLSPMGRASIEQSASSTSGLHTLSLSKVGRLVVPVAPLAEQLRVSSEVERLTSLSLVAEREVAGNISRITRLRQSILKWAFEGRLVDQDPSDEPAELLLERIRAERATSKGKKQSRSRRVNTSSAAS